MNIGRVRDHLARRPWVPLELVLDNGERIPIPHPEAVIIITDDDLAVVEDGRVHFIGPEAISMIDKIRTRRKRSR